MPINLRLSLLMQVVWLCLAAGYNLLSIYFISIDEQPLIVGKPLQSLMMLCLYLIPILLGYSRQLYPFIILSTLLLVGLLSKGVLPHLTVGLIENDFSRYSSHSAWFAAILINIFGSVAITLGVYKAINLMKQTPEHRK